jgi:hypothetical protein
VLWSQVWRSGSTGQDSGSAPWLHYLAVDSGPSDRTTAWGLPSTLASTCHVGDTVTLKVRRWTRRVLAVTVVTHGATGHRTDTAYARADLQDMVTEMVDGRPGSPAGALAAGMTAWAESLAQATADPVVGTVSALGTDEVGQALGVPVGAIPVRPPIGPSFVQFVTDGAHEPVLMLHESDGGLARRTWRVPRRARLLPGLGDEAWVHGDRGGVRAGDRVVLIILIGAGRRRREHLPWLVERAAARLPLAPTT